MVSKISCTLILAFMAFTSSAQEELSLALAVQKGLANNYEIRIAANNLEIAKNNNTWGVAGMFPIITAGANATYSDYQSTVSSETFSIKPKADLKWVLFNGFSIRINKRKLELLEKLSEGSSSIIIENTIKATILSYYRAIIEEKKLEILKQVMRVSKDRYVYINEKNKLGNAVTFDLLQAKNAYLSDSSNYILQKSNVKNSVRNLNLIIAEPHNNTYLFTDSLRYIDSNYKIGDLLKQMLGNNKTVQNKYLSLQLKEKDIEIGKSQLYPSLSLNLGTDKTWTENLTQNISSDSWGYYAAFSLNYTLSNGGKIRKAVQNAKIQVNTSKIELEEMKHKLTNKLFQLYELFEVRKQLYNVSIEMEKAARLNMEIAQEKYKNGSINSFNYRDIQLIYLNSAFNKIQSLYNLMDSQAELQKITGNIINENI